MPFTALDPATEAALQNVPAEFINVGRSNESYWELLDELWATKREFVIVEQDIVVRPSTIGGFRVCDRLWCCAKYPYLDGMFMGLGCCRFKTELMVDWPDVLDEVAEYHDSNHSRKHWCVVDHALSMALAARGVHPCDRHGDVGHRKGPPSHGCCP